MTSDDLIAITGNLRELILVNREQIAEMKAMSAQMQRDNAEFRAQMMKEQREFEARQDAKFDTFARGVDSKIDTLAAKIDVLTNEVVELQRDNEGLKHDVQGLYHWDYWLLTIILVVFAMPQIVTGLKSLFEVIIDGVAGIISLFSRKKD